MIYPLSVDTPGQSNLLSKEYRLPFTFLCDVEREVIKKYGVYHAHMRGQIANPATFIVNPQGLLVFRSLDRKEFRVSAADLLDFLAFLEKDIAHLAEGKRQKFMIPVIRQYLRDKGVLPNPYLDLE